MFKLILTFTDKERRIHHIMQRMETPRTAWLLVASARVSSKEERERIRDAILYFFNEDGRGRTPIRANVPENADLWKTWFLGGGAAAAKLWNTCQTPGGLLLHDYNGYAQLHAVPFPVTSQAKART
jgi:hypothetical protein